MSETTERGPKANHRAQHKGGRIRAKTDLLILAARDYVSAVHLGRGQLYYDALRRAVAELDRELDGEL